MTIFSSFFFLSPSLSLSLSLSLSFSLSLSLSLSFSLSLLFLYPLSFSIPSLSPFSISLLSLLFLYPFSFSIPSLSPFFLSLLLSLALSRSLSKTSLFSLKYYQANLIFDGTVILLLFPSTVEMMFPQLLIDVL